MAVLFVCLGNICRSPTAETVFRSLCSEVRCDSAGTAGWHVGRSPYNAMQAAAQRAGYDMGHLRARQIRTEDFERYSLIVAMDPSNVEDVEAFRPPGNQTRVVLLAPYAGAGTDSVPDPYYTRDFTGALTLIEEAMQALVAELRA